MRRIRDCKSDEDLTRIINEIRSSPTPRELLISLIILVKSSSLLQSMILLATSSFDIGLIGVNALNCLSNNGGELPSAFCFLCVHDIIHGSLNIAENCKAYSNGGTFS
nr:hypothetical protein [Tanacetum cinerariifolium]